MKLSKLLFILVISFIWMGVDMSLADSQEQHKKIKIFNARKGVVEEVEKVYKTDEEWKQILTPEQYQIMREKGTEEAFSGECTISRPEGIYQCAACGTDLFKQENKYDSGTGWPSFWSPVSELNIRPKEDHSFFMQRTEVLCARCDSHLGHVFDDGPPPTHKRYCINSLALKLYQE